MTGYDDYMYEEWVDENGQYHRKYYDVEEYDIRYNELMKDPFKYI